MSADLAGSGGSAVVTGASSGIGRAYAVALARPGRRMILVARRRARLDSVARELAALGAVPEVLEADLAVEGDIGRVAEHVRSLADLELLVHAAGFGTMGAFAEAEIRRQLEMVRVHVDAGLQLTHAALPAMRENRRGAVVLLSSIGAFLPAPENATYSATKAAIVAFARVLAMELAGTGVAVQALCPGFTHTEFHSTDEYRNADLSVVPEFMWMTPEQVVHASLASLGRRVVVVPGARNRALIVLGRIPGVSRAFIRRAGGKGQP